MNLEQGAVFAVPLEKGIGYAYVKCILTDEFGLMPGLMLKVFNIYTIELEKQIINKLSDADELTYRFLMLGRPATRGKHKWYLLGKQAITEDEKENIPAFRELSGPLLDIVDESDWSKLNWSVILNFNLGQRVKELPYSSIKHLGPWFHSSDVDITTRLTMIWLRRLCKDIRDYYNADEFNLTKNIWNIVAYNEANNVIFFDEIPHFLRGKIIE